MKVLLVSDLHTSAMLDRGLLPYSGFESLTSDDVVCVAGDVDDGPTAINKHLKLLSERTEATIVAVMGNHDYYHRELSKDTVKRAAEGLPQERVHILENESLVVGDVRFLGCTLWTDADKGRMAGNALAMQDYDYIHAPLWRKALGAIFIEATDTIAAHQLSRAFLERELAKPFAGKTVVVTHHAPSLSSVHKKYLDHPLTGFFAVELDDMIEKYQPDYWLHGHLHDPVGYVIGQKTKVRSNPRGYPDERARRGQYEPLVIEL